MKRILWALVSILIGAALGYGYYTFFGCRTGCPITSDPMMTMLWFGILGGLVYSIFLPEKKK